MASEEVIEEVEALTAILEEDTVEVVKEEGGDRPKVKHNFGERICIELTHRN